jgi:hypothetical protein
VPVSRTKKIRTERDLSTDLRKRQNTLMVATFVSLVINTNNITSEVRGFTGDENSHSLLLPDCTASQLQTTITFKQFFIHGLAEMNKLVE